MPLHQLKVVAVHKAREGDLADGGGLCIKVVNGTARAALRFTAPDGRRREAGLGVLNRASLAATGESLVWARELAEKARRMLADGVDPIEQKKVDRNKAKAETDAKRQKKNAVLLTLARAARIYHERDVEPSTKLTDRHKQEWIGSLERCVPAELWHAPVESITGPALLDAMVVLQRRVPETARRVRQRLELVFDDAEFRGGLESGKNPARAIRKRFEKQAPERNHEGFAALPFVKVPAFVQQLREQPGVAARALEFTLLTASRTAETLGATWSEFDFESRLWTIPGARMKAGQKHIVHLSDQALNVLTEVRDLDPEIVFRSPTRERQPLSSMGMLTVLRRMKLDKATTVHGLCRKSFSTWANETGAARPDVIEASLAHSEQDAVRKAYNKAVFLAERRQLLDAWAAYCSGKAPASNVVPIKASA